MNNQKIVIAGGAGFIGRALAAYFAPNNKVVILTRNVHEANNAYADFEIDKVTANIKIVLWDGRAKGDWCNEIDGSDVLINLAGKSVNCRYTAKNKQAIFDSRVFSTKALGEAVRNSASPPKLWLNAASATIYRHATDRPQDEYTGEMENDFSVQVCKLWEKTFFEQDTSATRKVALRMAIALGAGGVMVPYFNLLKFKLGGRQGSGKQMYSWVHIIDVCRAVEFIEAHTKKQGVYNISSPHPVTNNVFMETLRKATGHIIGLPAFEWMLAIGTRLIGSEAELILKSRWIIPTKLTDAGFAFKYPFLKDAFADIISKVPRKMYHLF